MFFVRVQVKIRWEPESLASYVEEREIITAKATQNVFNAKGLENQAMACHVHVAVAKDIKGIDNWQLIMNNAGNNIRNSLLKRQEAMARHNARKEKFMKEGERIIQDIEEARNIWKSTLKQFSNQPFN